MIFSNDIFLKAIQARTKCMQATIESYKSKIESCNADIQTIGAFSADLFVDPPGQLKGDKESIQLFIKLVKMKQLSELVLNNIKFSSDLQDFVQQNTGKLRTLFNHLELLTFNDDLSDNGEKCRLIFDLKYDLRSVDEDLIKLEQFFGKLHEILLQAHLKLTEFVGCYFSKQQRRERITLLDLRDSKIKTIKKHLARLKKMEAGREFQDQIGELENDLITKCNEVVEKTELMELILGDENESLYYAFHLLNDLSSALDEIQVHALNLKTTIEIVEGSDAPEDDDSGKPSSGGSSGSSSSSSGRDHTESPHANGNQLDSTQGEDLLTKNGGNNSNDNNIWSNNAPITSRPPGDYILFDGSAKGDLPWPTSVLTTGYEADRDLPSSSSLGSSTEISFINEQLNGSVSCASSLNESASFSSFDRSPKSTSSRSIGSLNDPLRSLSMSANTYGYHPAQPPHYNTPNGMPNGMPNRISNQYCMIPAPPGFRPTNGPLSRSTNSHLASRLNQPFKQPFNQSFNRPFSQPFVNQPFVNQPFVNQPFVKTGNDQPQTYAKMLTNQPPPTSRLAPPHFQPQPQPSQQQYSQRYPPLRSNWPLNNRSSSAYQPFHRQQPSTGDSLKPQLNFRFSASSSNFNSASNSTAFHSSSSHSAVDQQEAKKSPESLQNVLVGQPEGAARSVDQKENVVEQSGSCKVQQPVKTKCGRKQRMANRDRKLSTLSCEHKSAGSAKENPPPAFANVLAVAGSAF